MLDKLILSAKGPQWQKKVSQVHQAVKQATYFQDGDANDQALSDILHAVKMRGDKALEQYGRQFDKVALKSAQFRITQKELNEAHASLDKQLLAGLRKAIDNVRRYQKAIFIGKSKAVPGLSAGVRYTPIHRAGICVPGASAPLPSTVIMTAVPAQAAGVEEIAVVSPPRYQGTIHPVILGVCRELGITEVYRLGGAHAVAALAYGTKTIPVVDKIVGPGNQWVQMAKRKVFGAVDIDSVAGPSEVLIIADSSANPAWVAADMLSQAEHAPGSAFLFTTSARLAKAVVGQLEIQLAHLVERQEKTRDCLIQFGGIVVFDSTSSLLAEANRFAAEHLQIQCGKQSRKIAAQIRNAGAIFIGGFSPVAVGDYWAGPSHTLPTGTSARFFSPLSSNDFIKSISVMEYSQQKLSQNAADIIRLAQTEGLTAHAGSVSIRVQKK